MATDPASPRTRRALLAAALGAGAATVASALGRPIESRAATGDIVHVGDTLHATTPTTLINDTNESGPVLVAAGDAGAGGIYGRSSSYYGVWGHSATGTGVQGSSEWADGVYGSASGSPFAGVHGEGTGVSTAGVIGESTHWVGVLGHSTDNVAVHGISDSSTGVRGDSATSTAVWGSSVSGDGVLGQSVSRTGVRGLSGDGSVPGAPPKVGVYGYAAQDATACGVTGRSTVGRGVNGLATTGRGVHGEATSGLGVRGYATTGTGGSFEATTPTGHALVTSGRISFGKVSGIASIAIGKTSVTIKPGLDITASTFVLLTPKIGPRLATLVGDDRPGRRHDHQSE